MAEYEEEIENEPSWKTRLRQRAEGLLPVAEEELGELSAERLRAIVHELRVRQVEMELQQEELDRTRQELQRSHDNLERLFHQSPTGYLSLDDHGFIRHVNQRFLSMVDQPRNEVLGHALAEFLNPGDREIFLGRYGAFYRHPAGKTIYTRIVTNAGLPKHCRLEARLADPSGAEMQLMVTVSDVDDLTVTRSERDQLQIAVSKAADGIIVTDENGRIEYANKSVERITGYRVEELLGQNPRMLKSGRHDARFYSQLWKSIRSGKVWSGAMVNRRKDGSLYEEQISITPILAENGKIERFVSVMRDVTAEAVLERARWYFTAVTSHEMRTPLTYLNLVHALLDPVVVAEGHEGALNRAKSILRETYQRFDRIVSSTSLLLELQKKDSFIKGHPYPVKTLIHQTIEKYVGALKANDREIHLEHALGEGIEEASVSIDPELIHRALDEIMSNAIKYSPEGSTLLMSAKREEVFVRISVSDQGVGMNREELAVVKTPFLALEQPDNHTSGYGFLSGGVGLGLTLASLIVEKGGGRLEIDSEGKGKGVTVTMSLPLA